jgi:hypothetical protein
MGEIHHFVPNAHLKASENLAAFVESCRSQLTVFGSGLNFDADVWETSKATDRRGSSYGKRITFCTLATTGQDKKSDPMAEPFKSFAKAYIRYQQGLRPTKSQDYRIAALRVLEQILREAQGGYLVDPTAITADLLNQATELTKRRFAPATAYKVGANFELLAHFVNEHHLTPAATGWRNPIKPPAAGVRIGKEFEERRAAKMPSAAALDALAVSFNMATEPRDLIRASVGALLMSAPARIAEVLTLPEDCEASPPPGGDQKQYGLRWWPAKGADPQVKWVIPSMAGVAKRAVDKIRSATAQARTVAAWYEQNPGTLYLAPDFEHLRGQDLELEELAALLSRRAAYPFCTKYKLRLRNGRVRFAEAEAAILSMLPADFPVFDRKSGTSYSKALCVVLKHQFRDTPPIGCMIERVSFNHVADGFGSGVAQGRSTSLFDRMGFKQPDGTSIRVTSHQFRHLLNTMAQKGGATQFDIARWSGRKDFSQNTAYDHESAGELLARVQAIVGDDTGIFGLPIEIRINEPKTREEYGRMVAPTAHTTEIGFCLHDFSGSPCELHLDCLRCTEHVCVKGNRHKTEVVRRQLVEARAFLTKAEKGMTAEAWGADRWVAAHIETVERLEALLAILENPDLPDGSIIRVGGPVGPSRLVTAAAERGIDLSVPEPRSDPALDLARNLLQDMGDDRG